MRRKHLIRTIALSTVFALGVGILIYHNINKAPIRVEAEQRLTNYDSYSYSGNYYNSIDFTASQGMNGDLRKSLTDLITPKGFYTYGSSGKDHLSTQLQYADEDPTNSNNMVYLYTRNSVPKTAATVNSSVVWTREHVWCQSLSNGNWGIEDGGTDVLHLRPAYQNTNSSRNNKPYADLGKTGAKYFNNMLYGYSNSTYFEPIDCVKGDVARTIMYIWVTYTDYKNYKNLNITDVFESYDTLLRWHTLDEPDVLEGNRNNYSQSSIQENRNPFVDHPELAWKIFGDAPGLSSAVKTACQEAYPATGGGETINPTGIRLNKTSASMEEETTLQLSAVLEPTGASGSITWTSSDQSVAIVNSDGLVTANIAGSTTITAQISDSIKATCTLTVVAPADRTTLFIADLTSTKSISSGFSIPSINVSKKTGYYQDGSSTSECCFKGLGTSPLFTFEPSKITFRAFLGGTSAKDPLENNVEACLIDSSGNEIEDTKVVLTNKLISKDRTEYNVRLPYSADAYGAKISHVKIEGYNVRYYSFALYRSNSSPEPEDYLSSASSIATLLGNATVSQEAEESSVTFSEVMSNQQTIPNNFTIGEATLTGDKGSHVSASPTYYTNGTALRLYAGNTLTFSTSSNVARVTFTFASGYGSNDVVSSENAYLSNGSWVSSSNSVVFSIKVNSRITAVSVVCGGEVSSIDSLSVNYGAKISKRDWDSIASKWTISDYGFMLVRELKLINDDGDNYAESSIEEAYLSSKFLRIAHKGSGEAPYLNNGNYYFTVGITDINPSNYHIVYCAAPFVVIDDVYYFLNELRFSVNELAEYCLTNGGSNMPDTALAYLASN